MNDFVETHRTTARVDADEDPSPYLQAIENWQEAARQVADEAGRHGTKKAVRKCPPDDRTANALYTLFAIKAETIHHVCREAFNAHTESMHEDEPHLELQDILAEAYPLFLRSMVRYEPEAAALSTHLSIFFHNRVQDYIRSQLSTPDDPDNRPDVEDRNVLAPHFDIPKLYNELREEDRLPKQSEDLWDRYYTPQESNPS